MIYCFDFDCERHRKRAFDQLKQHYGDKVIRCSSPNCIEFSRVLTETQLARVTNLIASLSVEHRLTTLEALNGL